MNRYFLPLILSGIIATSWSCTSAQDGNSSERVKEIKSTDMDEMIRFPISADSGVDTAKMARIQMDEMVFNFDTVAHGDVVEHTFGFTNVGKSPLVISNAESTCGCTVPSWPEDPIPPGGRGEISVKFNTEDKPGSQTKPITIFANTYPQQTVVRLVGFVQK